MYAQSRDARALAKFAAAAREQLAAALPRADQLSPHALPERRSSGKARTVGLLPWFLIGGLFSILLATAISGWTVKQALEGASTAIAGTSPTPPRLDLR
jgi:hypothetical protein